MEATNDKRIFIMPDNMSSIPESFITKENYSYFPAGWDGENPFVQYQVAVEPKSFLKSKRISKSEHYMRLVIGQGDGMVGYCFYLQTAYHITFIE